MRIVSYCGLILAALFAFDARLPAQASPWCSTWSAVSCGYDSFEQCMQAIRGVGGSCIRNNAEPEIVPAAPVVSEAPVPPKARAAKPKPQAKPVPTAIQ